MTTTLARNVRAEMARRGWSQATVAELLGTSQAAVSRRLRGAVEFTAAELAILSGAFGVPVGVLFGEDAA